MDVTNETQFGRLSAFAGLVALLLGGCAHDLARVSSGAIGCPPEAIEISEVSVGWSQMSWTSRCREMTFYCAGEDTAQCSPALVDVARPSTELKQDPT